MIAIVIPYYKITFFEETLKSLANQTDKRFKVYIGDDASPEDPSKILEKYSKKFDFVYTKFENNLGCISLVKQWERCIKMANKEDWLMILGDDDVLGENVVKLFYKNLPEIKKENITVIRFSTCKINDLGNLISDVYQHPKIENAVDFFFRKTRSSLSEYVFNKKKINAIGFKDYPLGWFSDVLAVLEFSNFGNVYSIKTALIYIRISEISISGRSDNMKIKLKAVFSFYYYLLSSKYNKFTDEQRKILLNKINKCYLNDKKNMLMFIKISKIYFSNYLFTFYSEFLKSIFFNLKTNFSKNR
ncbi:hypothetical protein Lupro_02325 [Lutibacter profundi]|uniref:Glycosyltransferase 2-like domain-containing protein n=1 Tax=Lutibacter profundi TaxID=1622118 RepID=A0A0X8G504_9FLAO|nr:glycosyltransferase family 2 protein [Lutibacter profundi]AMC10155.1 hypothetical protein Lupro_02325 [Lutibacter profundi]